MAFELNAALIIPIIIIFVLVMAVIFLVNRLLGMRPKIQPVTRNQYERLVADLLVSAKLNRVKNIKWINITGDSTHPPIRHYAKYCGSVSHPLMNVVVWRVRWFTPRRINPIHWDLVHLWGEREIWVDCNGFYKDGYFFRPILTRDRCEDGRTVEKYDHEFHEFIKLLIGIQSLDDTFEQVAYEVMSAMTHKERDLDQLLMKPEYPIYDESERDFPVEPEG